MNQYLIIFGIVVLYWLTTLAIGYVYEILTHRDEKTRAQSMSWLANTDAINRKSWYYKATAGFSWIMGDYVPDFVKKYLWFLIQAVGNPAVGLHRVVWRVISPWYLLWDMGLPALMLVLGIAKPGPDWIYWVFAVVIYFVFAVSKFYKIVIAYTPDETHRGVFASFAGFVLAVYLSYALEVNLWLVAPMVLLYLGPVLYQVYTQNRK